MAGAALGNGSSVVDCTDGIIGTPCAFSPAPHPHPIAWHWDTPSVSATGASASNVLINGIPAVKFGDPMQPHPDGVPCTPVPIPHTPTLSTGSATVRVNGVPIGRIGDLYDGGTPFIHTIMTGSANVNIG